MRIGLVHPGEMGAAVGAALRTAGQEVLWASAGRSAATASRARDAGLMDAGTPEELAGRCDVVVSLCPPHAAVETATAFSEFGGIYVDANAISPATAQAIAGTVGRYADGGVVGPPPWEPGTTRLYLSGAEAPAVAELFAGSPLDAVVIPSGSASAMKMAYAAWSKGTAALLLAIEAVARAEGVEETLRAEWVLSLPNLSERLESARRSAEKKGWRWVGEMEEIAATFAAAGQPDGFHRAAAEVYRGSPRPPA
jgi:3-hydroxyisobutyrate dehydrogenase-like beta-hydroxyacid dehydrogenase